MLACRRQPIREHSHLSCKGRAAVHALNLHLDRPRHLSTQCTVDGEAVGGLAVRAAGLKIGLCSDIWHCTSRRRRRWHAQPQEISFPRCMVRQLVGDYFPTLRRVRMHWSRLEESTEEITLGRGALSATLSSWSTLDGRWVGSRWRSCRRDLLPFEQELQRSLGLAARAVERAFSVWAREAHLYQRVQRRHERHT